MLAVQANGRAVRTIEGLAAAGAPLHPLQRAFHERHALQCGFCTPGFLHRRRGVPARAARTPSEREMREALAGNLCRCTGYEGIVNAVLDVAARTRAGGARDGCDPGTGRAA